MYNFVHLLLFYVLLLNSPFYQQPIYSSEDFEKLTTMTGLWEMQTKHGSLFEQWRRISPNEFEAVSFKLNKTDTVPLETVTIKYENNSIFYMPVVKGQNDEQPVIFKLIDLHDEKFTFENKEHDFPQRVIYNLISKDSITARIEGNNNGKEMHSDFYYKRVK